MYASASTILGAYKARFIVRSTPSLAIATTNLPLTLCRGALFHPLPPPPHCYRYTWQVCVELSVIQGRLGVLTGMTKCMHSDFRTTIYTILELRMISRRTVRVQFSRYISKISTYQQALPFTSGSRFPFRYSLGLVSYFHGTIVPSKVYRFAVPGHFSVHISL